MYIILYPGQGAYASSIGLDLYNNFKVAKDVFDELDEVMSFKLSKELFINNTNDILTTELMQPAIFATCIALSRVVEHFHNKQISDFSSFILGHSLGQYTALHMAGVIRFSDALKMIKKRAELMQKSCDKYKGKMLACFSADYDILSEIIHNSQHLGVIQIANYNSSTQTVISGSIEAVDYAKDLLVKAKIKFVELNLSGAFHTNLMLDAAKDFEQYLSKITFNKPKAKVISNATAKEIASDENFVLMLSQHIVNPVKWRQSINYCLDHNVSNKQIEIVEITPKPILSNFLKRDNIQAAITVISSIDQIEKFVPNITS